MTGEGKKGVLRNAADVVYGAEIATKAMSQLFGKLREDLGKGNEAAKRFSETFGDGKMMGKMIYEEIRKRFRREGSDGSDGE